MNYAFIGIFYLGWWTGWSAPVVKLFNTYEECDIYINELGDQLRFCKLNNCHGDWPSDWSMTCKPTSAQWAKTIKKLQAEEKSK